MSFNFTVNQQAQTSMAPCFPRLINPADISRDFCNFYYTGMSVRGLSGLLDLFEQGIPCNFNGSEYTGMHNMVVRYAEEGISKLIYDKLTCIYQILTHDTLLVQVNGLAQGITFSNSLIDTKHFSETFVIKHFSDDKFRVVNYIFRLI